MNKPTIVVAGGVNIDIGGYVTAPLIPQDSNPGTIHTSVGGVGRNIAQNLSLMGEKVTFLTALGYDMFGQRVLSECAQGNLDMSSALVMEGFGTSMYVFLNRPDGEMELAVNDMHICEYLTPEYFGKHMGTINKSKLLVIDANLPEASIDFLTENAKVPVFADLVSTAKSKKIKSYLSRLHTIKPNKIEAEMLSGITISDEASLQEAAKRILDTGVKNVYISLSRDGIYAASQSEQCLVPICRADIINTTGAGDACMAALAYAYLCDFSLEESARYANAAAAIAMESENTISEYMTLGQIKNRVKSNYGQ